MEMRRAADGEDGEKVEQMSALTRREGHGLPDLLDWLEAPHLVLHPLAGQTMRTEEGVEDGRYLVRAEIPGIDPEKQAEVRVSDGILTIHAERNEEMENPRRCEFRYGSFTRHVPLPAGADENDVEAAYDKGILEVSIGLKADDEAARAGRVIPVRLAQHIKPT
jgi:HSP20 family protein